MDSPARRVHGLPVDRRESPRIPILGNLAGEVMVFQPMTITEIGPAGIQIETTFPFQINSVHDLRLELGAQPVVLKGRVTHCSIVDVEHEAVRYRSGIHFVDVPPHATAAIRAFIATMGSDEHR